MSIRLFLLATRAMHATRGLLSSMLEMSALSATCDLGDDADAWMIFWSSWNQYREICASVSAAGRARDARG
jgi:hypothetical protein